MMITISIDMNFSMNVSKYQAQQSEYRLTREQSQERKWSPAVLFAWYILTMSLDIPPFSIALIPYVSNWILTNYYPVPFAFPFPSSPALQLIARMSNCDPALSWPRSRRRSAYIEMEIYLPSQWVLDFCPTVRPRCQTSIEDLEHLVFIRRLCL